MIRFALKCAQGHAFESWFKSNGAFDALSGQGLITCPDCGASDVTKALMAPSVSVQTKAPLPPAKDDLERRIATLKAEVEANSDYVGTDFVTQARAMYLGDMPDRPIHGEAAPAEAKALIDDGVPIVPLPFVPSRKAN
ncbi:MAG: DUF1178 family protein [Roseinatronobacter sp.]